MNQTKAEIRIRGKDLKVPSLIVAGRELVVTGRWLKTAAVKDEAFVEGEVVADPEQMISALKGWKVRPDLFTFTQKVTDPTPRYPYSFNWDDFAVISITTYEHWLKTQIKKDVKENLRRANREGVVVRAVKFDDAFLQGVKGIFDETPIRQGMRFWHYGKSLAAIRDVLGTYSERAEYIGAFFGEELIGFIKMVYVDNFAKTMHVNSKEMYFHKRTANALLAKAVEICASRKLSYFIYGVYNFPGKKGNSLSAFKQHNGFVEIKYPRYFIPLTTKGRIALLTEMHYNPQRHIPFVFMDSYLKFRSLYYHHKFKKPRS